MKLAERIAQSLRSAASSNAQTSAATAAVLWPDKDGLWRAALPQLAPYVPSLLVLGAFDPARKTGPAIWLKCAVAGALPDIDLAGQVPIICLPGVSRADLRAIGDCPRELQPLAELQYRGAFWSQANAKDWSPNAFLTSKNGGLGLDVSQDRDTQDALVRALHAGVLLGRTVEELQGRQINAAWLDSLSAPNPTRDILVWMNDNNLAQSQWAGARWDIFRSRCRKDFGFDPLTDGALSAAEKLAARHGAWAAVWELYRDSFASFPAVAELLSKLQPPRPLGLFDDPEELAGYPRANDDAESALRYKLNACAAMLPEQARVAVREVEKEHGGRRAWLWARMGRARLAAALEHLAALASLSTESPGGATLAKLAGKYEEVGWKVDQAALQALAAVSTKADTDAVGIALRALYVPWLEASAQRFQELVKAEGRLSPPRGTSGVESGSDPPPEGVCTVFVDGLRYDVAMRLKDRLSNLGKVSASAAWTCMPSVTASGKAWASPVAPWVAGRKDDEDFQPSVAVDGKPLSTYNFRKLLSERGYQVLDKHETGAPSGRAWVECGDLDHYGHAHGLRLAKDIDHQLAQIAERVGELNEAGWGRFRIVTDHGWLLVPGGLPKTELSKFEAETRWGRCAVLKDSSHGTPLTFGWDWCQDVQIAFAPGIASFIAGAEYAHGGLTLQECLVPVLELVAASKPSAIVKADITKVVWNGLRCRVEVSTESPQADEIRRPPPAGVSKLGSGPAFAHEAVALRVDIRTKAALSDSSLVAQVKALDGGKVSLAVADDSNQGTAAFVVVLDAAGTVIQKRSTTVGE